MKENWLYIINERSGGWLSTISIIVSEVIVVYVLSNIPFILLALDAPATQDNDTGFVENFIFIISDKLNKGELLIFACTLIAPAIFWGLAEFNKALTSKFLLLFSFLVWTACVYLFGKESNFSQISSFTIYSLALAAWIVSICCREIPPENKPPSPNKEAAILTQHLKNLESDQS